MTKYLFFLMTMILAGSSFAKETRGSNIIEDGFEYYGESGFCFRTGTVCPWSNDDSTGLTKPDMLAAATDEQTPNGIVKKLRLFIPHFDGNPNQKDFTDPDRPEGGMHRLKVDSLESGVHCPKKGVEANYSNKDSIFWQNFNVGDTFCLYSRHGGNYAFVKITGVSEEGIRFDWRYNDNKSSDFSPIVDQNSAPVITNGIP